MTALRTSLGSFAVLNKELQKALIDCGKLNKRSNDRLSLEDRNVTERYLSGDAYLRLSVHWMHRATGTKVCNYDAFIYRVGPIVQNEQIGIAPALESVIGEATQLPSCGGRNEFEMFVNIAETEDGPEVLVPSIVRFQEPDEFLEVPIDTASILLSAGQKPFEIISRRKIDIFDVWFASRK